MSTFQVKDAGGANIHLAASGAGTLGDPYIPKHADNRDGVQKLRLDRYLDLSGDGTGGKVATGDYSTPDVFYIQPKAGEIFQLTRMIVYIQDGTGAAADKYGGMTALTNGITVQVKDDSGVISDMTDGVPIKTNSQWRRICYDGDPSSYGTGDDAIAIRWTFEKAGTRVRLVGDDNERLEVQLADDFTGLVDHTFFVQGFVE